MKNKTTQLLIAPLLIIGTLLGACTQEASPTETPAIPEAASIEAAPTEAPATLEPTLVPEPEKMVFVDDLGNTIEFTDYPQAIVSLSPSTTEILFAIGAGEQVVGRDAKPGVSLTIDLNR